MRSIHASMICSRVIRRIYGDCSLLCLRYASLLGLVLLVLPSKTEHIGQTVLALPGSTSSYVIGVESTIPPLVFVFFGFVESRVKYPSGIWQPSMSPRVEIQVHQGVNLGILVVLVIINVGERRKAWAASCTGDRNSVESGMICLHTIGGKWAQRIEMCPRVYPLFRAELTFIVKVRP